jgi:serine phosphatase RsbU (regulator of sigma subunit)
MRSDRPNRFGEASSHGPWPSPDESQLIEQFRRIAELQWQLLPREIPQPAGWRIATYYSVGPWPSGDYYDIMTLPDGRIVIAVADASGHGGLAAVMVAVTRVILRSCPLTSGRERQPFCPLQGSVIQTPHIVLAHLNRVLIENSLEGQFMTAFYCVLNPLEGALHYANAGHPRPRWWRSAYSRVDSVRDVAGFPLGLDPHAVFHQCRMEIEPGDVLVCYSDGLTEARSESDEQFGDERLDEAIRESVHSGAEAVKAGILDHLVDFLAGREPQDDVTIVVVERLK